MVSVRPSTIRRLRKQKQAVISPLHVSIAKMSYMRDHQSQPIVEQKEEHPFFRMTRPQDRQKSQ
jgi:hypothetical protein